MNKIKKIIWFATRPKYFFILLEILKNKFSPSYNNSSLKTCRIKQISLKSFSRKVFKKNNKNYNLNKHIDFKNIVKKINNNKTMLKQGQNNRKYKIILNNQNIMKMSGASSISLIYKIIREKKPKNILETGVAYGWSSYSILLAILHNKLGKLISIDLPYPLMNEKRNIGMVVPKKLTRKWKLIFGRDTDGIKIALSCAAIITTLLAAWIKKENYAGRIQETDRYLQKIQKLTTECDHILSQDVDHRISYQDYVEEHQQSVVNALAATVPISPEEYKKAVYNITKYYPETVQNLWPWYESKHLSGKIYYYEMTDFGNDVLKSYRQLKYHNCINKLLCCYYCQSKCCEAVVISVFTDPINYNKYEVDKKIKLLNYKDRFDNKVHHIVNIKNNNTFRFLNEKHKSYEKKNKLRNKLTFKKKSRSTLESLRPYCYE